MIIHSSPGTLLRRVYGDAHRATTKVAAIDNLHHDVFAMHTKRSALLRFLPVTLGLLSAAIAMADTSPPPADFTGVWQLDNMHSDNASDITRRLHAERRREESASAQLAVASSSGPPSSSPNPSGHHGGGHGMGGGGMGGGGRHGNHGQDSSSDSSSSAPPRDPTPPLLDDDSLLNVTQDSKALVVMVGNSDRLDGRFDGVGRQSLNGSAMVQTQATPDGMQISMHFKDGTELDQNWVRSSDGKQLTVTETWTTDVVKEPIIFRRSYTRLDL